MAPKAFDNKAYLTAMKKAADDKAAKQAAARQKKKEEAKVLKQQGVSVAHPAGYHAVHNAKKQEKLAAGVQKAAGLKGAAKALAELPLEKVNELPKKTKTMSVSAAFDDAFELLRCYQFTLLQLLYVFEPILIACRYYDRVLKPSSIARLYKIRELGSTATKKLQSAFQLWCFDRTKSGEVKHSEIN